MNDTTLELLILHSSEKGYIQLMSSFVGTSAQTTTPIWE